MSLDLRPSGLQTARGARVQVMIQEQDFYDVTWAYLQTVAAQKVPRQMLDRSRVLRCAGLPVASSYPHCIVTPMW